MRLIDADANIETMKKCAENPESEQALLCYRFAQRILEEAPTVPTAPRWVRCEENPPKQGCYLTASPAFYGDDYSWMYRLAWWTEHGLMDFVQDAEKESGWYIWNPDQDRDTEVEPMYWMPIEPPREGME